MRGISPVTALNPALPPAFSRIVARALEKDPERRFQTAAGLRDDLASISRGRRRPFLVAAAALVTLALVGAIGAVVSRRNPVAAEPFEHFRMTRLTTSGTAVRAAISRDGRHVLQVVVEGGRQSLRVQQTESVDAVQIVPPADVLTPGPDSNDVYFVTYPKDANIASLYRVSMRGGAPVKILENIDTGVSFSPDSKRFAFVRGFTGGIAVVVANVDGTGQREIARATSEVFCGKCPLKAENRARSQTTAFSRSRCLLTARSSQATSGMTPRTGCDWRRCPSTGPGPSECSRWGPRTVAWTPDGRLTYVENARGVGNVWQLPLDGTPPRQLTRFLTDRVIAFAWSPDGTKLAAARGKMTSDVVLITDMAINR
jgi:WD40 repeat protein